MAKSDLVYINDDNYRSFISPYVNKVRRRCSYYGMWKPLKEPAFSGSFADLGVPLIPESDWDDIIATRNREQASLKQLCEGAGLEVLDQANTNYCWINAPTFCCMLIRLQETGQNVRYSPASAGARIKNFRNVGGWGSEGLEWIREHGVNLQADWPANAIERRYDTPENRQKALLNRGVEYFVLDNFDEVASCCLAGIPVAVGYNWWLHEVTAVDILLGNHDLLIANSWGFEWSDRGFGALQGRKKIPDDAVAFTSLAPA